MRQGEHRIFARERHGLHGRGQSDSRRKNEVGHGQGFGNV